MPRIRQNADKYRREDFERRCRAQMVLLGLDDRALAEQIGMSHTTLWRRIRNPDELRVEELVKLIDALKLGVEDVLALAGMRNALVELKREMRQELKRETQQPPQVPVELRILDNRTRNGNGT